MIHYEDASLEHVSSIEVEPQNLLQSVDDSNTENLFTDNSIDRDYSISNNADFSLDHVIIGGEESASHQEERKPRVARKRKVMCIT
jgi:hypothetical protein